MQNSVWGYSGTQTHGGVIDQNVTFDDEGNLVLIANGDWYVGDKQGIVNTSNISVTGGQRTGASITSTQTYGPGSFEVVMKLPSFNGICTSMWLFNYRDNGEGAKADNWEIDIEVHGTTSENQGNYANPLFTTWITETDYTSEYRSIGYSLADGQFHRYRIDWHTGANARVEYYIDGKLWCTQTTNVPDNEMYLNIGCWFPRDWCGQPDFETDFVVVKGFSYTPFAGESANKVNCEGKTAGGFLNDVAIPAKNLLANGNFDVQLQEYTALRETTENLRGTTCDAYGWQTTDVGATIENGNVTFDGTLSQTVTMDCLGVGFTLLATGTGNGTVRVTYQSIVDGVVVTGSASGTVGAALNFTPPTNCTQLLVEIVSDGSLTLGSVVLNVAA